MGTGRCGVIGQGGRHGELLRGTGPDANSGGAIPVDLQLNHVVVALRLPGGQVGCSGRLQA